MRPTASQAVDGEARVKRAFCRKAPDVQALIQADVEPARVCVR
jgi:hypothetical protein